MVGVNRWPVDRVVSAGQRVTSSIFSHVEAKRWSSPQQQLSQLATAKTGAGSSLESTAFAFSVSWKKSVDRLLEPDRGTTQALHSCCWSGGKLKTPTMTSATAHIYFLQARVAIHSYSIKTPASLKGEFE